MRLDIYACVNGEGLEPRLGLTYVGVGPASLGAIIRSRGAGSVERCARVRGLPRRRAMCHVGIIPGTYRVEGINRAQGWSR